MRSFYISAYRVKSELAVAAVSEDKRQDKRHLNI